MMMMMIIIITTSLSDAHIWLFKIPGKLQTLTFLNHIYTHTQTNCFQCETLNRHNVCMCVFFFSSFSVVHVCSAQTGESLSEVLWLSHCAASQLEPGSLIFHDISATYSGGSCGKNVEERKDRLLERRRRKPIYWICTPIDSWILIK